MPGSLSWCSWSSPSSAAAPCRRPGASESIKRYDVDITIEPSGTLLVRETIDYDFGVVPHHGIFRDILTRFDYTTKANTDRVYPIDVISVKASEGTPADYSVETEGKYERIKIGDPDRTITGEHQYEITYRVRGAMNGFKDHDELVWNAIGTEWAVPIGAANVTVHAPAEITAVNCSSGPFGSYQPCGSATASGDTATFSAKELFPGFALGPFNGDDGDGRDPEGRGSGTEADPRGAVHRVVGVPRDAGNRRARGRDADPPRRHRVRARVLLRP